MTNPLARNIRPICFGGIIYSGITYQDLEIQIANNSLGISQLNSLGTSLGVSISHLDQLQSQLSISSANTAFELGNFEYVAGTSSAIIQSQINILVGITAGNFSAEIAQLNISSANDDTHIGQIVGISLPNYLPNNQTILPNTFTSSSLTSLGNSPTINTPNISVSALIPNVVIGEIQLNQNGFTNNNTALNVIHSQGVGNNQAYLQFVNSTNNDAWTSNMLVNALGYAGNDFLLTNQYGNATFNIGISGTNRELVKLSGAQNQTGKVGVSQSNPQYTLDVGGDINSLTDIRIAGNSLGTSISNLNVKSSLTGVSISNVDQLANLVDADLNILYGSTTIYNLPGVIGISYGFNYQVGATGSYPQGGTTGTYTIAQPVQTDNILGIVEGVGLAIDAVNAAFAVYEAGQWFINTSQRAYNQYILGYEELQDVEIAGNTAGVAANTASIVSTNAAVAANSASIAALVAGEASLSISGTNNSTDIGTLFHDVSLIGSTINSIVGTSIPNLDVKVDTIIGISLPNYLPNNLTILPSTFVNSSLTSLGNISNLSYTSAVGTTLNSTFLFGSSGFIDNLGSSTAYVRGSMYLGSTSSRIFTDDLNMYLVYNGGFSLSLDGLNCNIYSLGGAYKINGNSVLNRTTLGSGVVNSSLTSLGTINSLSYNSAIGITTSTTWMTGTTANLTSVILQNAGEGQQLGAIYNSSGTLLMNCDTSHLYFGITYYTFTDPLGHNYLDISPIKTTIYTPAEVQNNLNLTTGNAYQINGNSVLSGTSLGNGIVSSSLTSFGNSPTINKPTIGTSMNVPSIQINEMLLSQAVGNSNANTSIQLFHNSGSFPTQCYLQFLNSTNYSNNIANVIGSAGNDLILTNNVGDITLSVGRTNSNKTAMYILGSSSGGHNPYIALGNFLPSHTLQLLDDDAAKSTTSTWTITSDARVKKNIIKNTDNSLEIINKLDFKNYNYTGITGIDPTKTHMGLLAQDVELVPELKKCVIEKDLLKLNYHEIFLHGIKAIQQISKELNELQSKLK